MARCTRKNQMDSIIACTDGSWQKAELYVTVTPRHHLCNSTFSPRSLGVKSRKNHEQTRRMHVNNTLSKNIPRMLISLGMVAKYQDSCMTGVTLVEQILILR